MRVMVTGARGLLGTAIAREFAHGCELHALDHAALDITSSEAVTDAVDHIRPDVIINCAAFNDVDGAEDAAESALAVNAFGVLALARAAERVPCAVVHYSTDFVFDGETTRPYTEQDEPHPRSFYGLSKLLGEWFACEHSRAWVIRVESLFGDFPPNGSPRGSVHAIVSRTRTGEEVPVFTDRTVSPSYTTDLAHATRALVEAGVPPGLYHCVNAGAATWEEIAAEVAKLLRMPLRVKRMTLESAGLKAPRPRYSALSNAKLAAAGIVMPTWQDALQRHLAAVNR
jgi:dTDP-4-dehydrorhamnose reductase